MTKERAEEIVKATNISMQELSQANAEHGGPQRHGDAIVDTLRKGAGKL